MLGGDPGRVLHRHLVPGKRHHLRAEGDVDVVEGGVPEVLRGSGLRHRADSRE
jgi:hypothetical protein